MAGDTESLNITPSGKQALFFVILLGVGLALEAGLRLWGEILFSLAAWAVFLWLYAHARDIPTKILLLSCIAVATLGEIFCSLIWQLYTYRLHNIPPYVPPGHVFLFLTGMALAPRMPNWIVWFVPIVAAPYVIAGFYLGFDRFGAVLFAFFIACLLKEGSNKRLYATMFILALALEVYGTGLGCWTWQGQVPFWDISNINPPPASGAFYCILDLLVLSFAQPLLRLKSYPAEIATGKYALNTTPN